MDLHLRERRALIMGAAGGIGSAVAEAFTAEGVHLALVDRSAPNGLASSLSDGGHRAVALAADATDESQVERAVADAAEALGGLDLVIGCAGISGPFGTDLVDTTLDDWRRVFDVNVTGAFLLLKHALPVLRAGTDPAAVFVASDSALVAAGGMAAYCASKAALVQLMRAASVEEDAVRITAVCPSIVDTPMSRGDLGLDGGFGDVDYPVQSARDVAAEIAFLASPVARAVDATTLVSDFGYTARSSFPA
ncbi:SDR family NAD(P)-dependent oxidoreductase [Humibacter ginsenosidimutans]|uniref:SDR family oxidoreductase n=1 Tax=Humibacter ginsenosidimutans TaxID=2599293 RepID=A0A5B8M1W5_9MICO|nr:SDR family oxidoreductase [Humibacter ginsenosidimutans]QDZ14647.1 SDR family oxidoreductase [Humibacter ginsenosidimutans]